MARELSVMVIPAFRYISLLVRISPEASGQSGLVRFPFFFYSETIQVTSSLGTLVPQHLENDTSGATS